MTRWIFMVFISMTSIILHAQVVFNEPQSVTDLITRYKAVNKESSTVKAWRIQIVSTDDRRQMEKVRSEFSSLFPGYNSSWKHVAPYYQVRVGAYRTKSELMPFLAELKSSFPTATPVVDDVQKIEFVR